MERGNSGSPDLTDWVPFGVRWGDADGQLDWCHIGESPFTDPFFGQTIDRCRRELGKEDHVTSLEALDDLPIARPPAAFIFHTSRCGSTLVAQILASVPRFMVISEAFILSSILRPPARFFTRDHEEHIWLLRNVVNALALPRRDLGAPCFIKFSSRDVHELPLIRSAFPEVPWVFLYREPLEVVSALAGIQRDVLPTGLIESGLLGGDLETVRGMRPAEFWARVLSRCYQAALREFDPAKTRLVNYRQLPEIVWTSLLSDFGIACSDEEIESMRSASRFNAKAPARLFFQDTDHKRSMTTDEIRAVVEEWPRRDYDRLESLRLSSSGS